MMSSLPSSLTPLPSPSSLPPPTAPAQPTDRVSPSSRPPESEIEMTPPLVFAPACDDVSDAGETRALLSSHNGSHSSSAPHEQGAVVEAIARDDLHAVPPVKPSRNSDEWEVITPLGSGRVAHWCGASRHARVLEVVTLRDANFGLRWAGATAKRERKHRHWKNKRGGNDDKDEDDDESNAKRASAPFCVVGPHWWLMAGTYAVLFLAALVVTVLTVPQAGAGEAATGVLLSAACLAMYAKVACTNPGIVEHLDEPLADDYTYCGECESYRPPDALHCMDCRACIEGYDHHCPWTGKCIGRRNLKYFYAWLFFLVLAFVYEMIEFTTYMLPPEDQPHPYLYDDDDDSFSLDGSPPPLAALEHERTLSPSPALRSGSPNL